MVNGEFLSFNSRNTWLAFTQAMTAPQLNFCAPLLKSSTAQKVTIAANSLWQGA